MTFPIWLLFTLLLTETAAFTTGGPRPYSTVSRHAPRSRWIIGAAAKKKKKAGAKKAPTAGGFGSPTKIAAPTPAERLKKSMQVYESLLEGRATEAEEDEVGNVSASGMNEEPEDVLVKYVLTLRSCEPSSPAEFSDWVPVALTNLVCGTDANPDDLMPDVVGALCREAFEAGAQSYPVLRKAPPQSIEYAYETFSGFENHIFDGLLGRPERRAEAAKVLGVKVGASPAEVKKAHRGFMKSLHPDMFVGDEEGAEKANTQMLEVQNAYGVLGGGMGSASGSWYAAVGGKERVDFSGPLTKEQLGAIGKPRLAQEMKMSLGGWRAGVFPMEPSVTKEFVTRNILRSLDSSD
jgi:hypothetical protein